MKIRDYIDTAMEIYHKDSNNNSNSNKSFPKLPSTTETLPYVRHFGPLNVKAPQLLADLKPESPFENPEKIYFRNFLFVGVPKTKVKIFFIFFFILYFYFFIIIFIFFMYLFYF